MEGHFTYKKLELWWTQDGAAWGTPCQMLVTLNRFAMLGLLFPSIYEASIISHPFQQGTADAIKLYFFSNNLLSTVSKPLLYSLNR